MTRARASKVSHGASSALVIPALAAALAVGHGCTARAPGSTSPRGTCAGDASASRPDAASALAALNDEPIFEKGLILPSYSLPCVPASTGVPQTQCNHHGSEITELGDGTWAVVWFHGVKEGSVDSRLVWSKLAPGSKAWTAPVVLFDDPGRAEGNAAIFVTEDGALNVVFATVFGSRQWDQARVRLIRSTDGGASWSAPVSLRDAYCSMTRHRPLRIANGEWLLPLYDECAALPAFMRSRDHGKTWDYEGLLSLGEHAGQIQPTLSQRDDGTLLAYTRDGTLAHRVKQMISADLGKTWSPSERTELPNAGTSIEQVRLKNGHVIVAFNNAPTERFPLSAALSVDEGRSFVRIRNLNDENVCASPPCSFAYPSIQQSSKDGSLWLSYTFNRETIGWVHFNESWLAKGTDSALVSCAPGETCKDAVCFKSCETDGDCDSTRSETCAEKACQVRCAVPTECCAGEGCAFGACVKPSISRCMR